MTKTKKEIKGFWADCGKAIRRGWKEDWAALVPCLVSLVEGLAIFACAVVKTIGTAVKTALDLTVVAAAKWVIEKIKRV